MKTRLQDAIDYIRAEMDRGFYDPDKEYLEVLIYYAELSCNQTISNAEILMFILGWQGGTIHDVATALGVSAYSIADADYEKMQDLMRSAQKIRRLVK